MGSLNQHPFAVEAFFEKSLVLAYAVKPEELKPLIPSFLEPDLFDDQWGFVAAAMVDTRSLRPKGFPKILGRNFTLMGYRVFVRYRSRDGRRLRGLYILGSETNRGSMQLLGNVFTQYRYQTVGVEWTSSETTEEVTSANGLQVKAKRTSTDSPLPVYSPFANWKEARRFAGPMPFTFSHWPGSSEVVIVEGVRTDWKPLPMEVEEHSVPFFDPMNFSEMKLANAFLVERVPYFWRKGRTETLAEK